MSVRADAYGVLSMYPGGMTHLKAPLVWSVHRERAPCHQAAGLAPPWKESWEGVCLRNTVTVSFSRPVSSMWLKREARGTSRQARTGPTRKRPRFLQGAATRTWEPDAGSREGGRGRPTVRKLRRGPGSPKRLLRGRRPADSPSFPRESHREGDGGLGNALFCFL